MSQSMISADNLGKKYRLRHQAGSSYTTFREMLTAHAKRLFHRSQAVVSLESVEEFWAVKDVSFDIPRGQVVGVIGRNGAGKSTLLKLISRITEPTTGRLRLRGRVASLMEVGTGFHPELSGRENIYLNGAILGMTKSEIRSKFDEIVAFAEVERFLDTAVKHYSSGMYVRLAFAVAAHLEPEILIVDEVLAVGDAQFQQKCIGKMQDVANESGRTILFVSHNVAAVERLCATAIMMSHGRVKFFGDTAVALQHYRQELGSGDNLSAMLTARPRPSWAKPFIQTAEICNEAEHRCGVFAVDGTLCLKLSFAAGSTGLLKAPCLGIVLKNSSYAPVAAVNMRMTGDVQVLPMSEGAITCTIPHLYLAPGRYTIDAWLGDGLVDVDMVEDCAAFEVATSDVYGSGIPPFSHLGNYVLQPTWRVTPTAR